MIFISVENIRRTIRCV